MSINILAMVHQQEAEFINADHVNSTIEPDVSCIEKINLCYSRLRESLFVTRKYSDLKSVENFAILCNRTHIRNDSLNVT